MRFLGKTFLFFFSIAHRLVMVLVNAHVTLARELFSRHPDADRPRPVSRN